VELSFEVVSENPIEETKPAAAPERKERRPRNPRPAPTEAVEAVAVVETVVVAEDGEPVAHKPKKRVRKEKTEDADEPAGE
jgi:hypothetical protein